MHISSHSHLAAISAPFQAPKLIRPGTLDFSHLVGAIDGNDDDFDLLLELADEIDTEHCDGGTGLGGTEEEGGSLPKDYAAFIPASDGEESEQEVGMEDDPLAALAEEADFQEPPPKRPKANQAGGLCRVTQDIRAFYQYFNKRCEAHIPPNTP